MTFCFFVKNIIGYKFRVYFRFTVASNSVYNSLVWQRSVESTEREKNLS